MNPVIKDERSNTYSDGYTYTRIVHTQPAGHVIRTKVRRDSRIENSYAVAEVLNSLNTWTDLIEEPVDVWRDETPTHSPAPWRVLGQLADALVERATNVLPS